MRISDLNENGGFADLGGGVGRQRRDHGAEHIKPVLVGSPMGIYPCPSFFYLFFRNTVTVCIQQKTITVMYTFFCGNCPSCISSKKKMTSRMKKKKLCPCFKYALSLSGKKIPSISQ